MRSTLQSKPAEQTQAAAASRAVQLRGSSGRTVQLRGSSRSAQPKPLAASLGGNPYVLSMPRISAQRKQLHAAFGNAILQEAGPKDEETQMNRARSGRVQPTMQMRNKVAVIRTQSAAEANKTGLPNRPKPRMETLDHGPVQRKAIASSVIQLGPFDWLGPVNPRLYMPTWLGGHSLEHMAERQQMRANLPEHVKAHLANAYQIVSTERQKRAPNHITLQEHGDMIRMLEGIHAGNANLLISPELSKPDYSEAQRNSVKNQLHTETLKDLVKITQTVQGRTLLKKLSTKDPRDQTKTQVSIRPTDISVPPDAAPLIKPTTDADHQKPQRSFARYTPTSILQADAYAMAQYRNLEANNPWVMPGRADVSLFHELVHTEHIQSGTFLPKSQLVTRAKFPEADPGDIQDEGGKEVPEEEYRTVGLHQYENQAFTDRKYREERRALGEEVPDRPYYSHRE
jgi:hypothetical protein